MIISPPILLTRDIAEHEDLWIERCMTGDAPGRGAYPLSHEQEWHGGLHLTAQRTGTRLADLCAVADGKVIFLRRPTEVAPSDKDHPLNYHDGYTSDACIVLEHTVEICQGAHARFTFYSVYHHLTALNDKLEVGMEVRRRDKLGHAGRIYHEEDRFHFEICCDDANLAKLIGRCSGPLSTEADGRTDIVFGEIYFAIPVGTPIYASEPAHFRLDGQIEQALSKGTPASAATQVQAPACTTTSEMIIGVRVGRGLGSVTGGTGPTTYRPDGSQIATMADSDGGKGLPKTAKAIVGAWERAHNASPKDYPNVPEINAVLELLRYGRVIHPGDVTLAPADTPHWRQIKYEGGEGWINLNADNVRKFSDADFPHWKGWLLVDDDSAASDCKCDSPLIKKILGASGDLGSGPRDADAALSDVAVQAQLKKTVCKFPCEWEEATLEARWSWLKTTRADQPTAMTEKDYAEVMAHLKALCIDCPPLFAAQWRFEPREFIKLFRRCGWSSVGYRISASIGSGNLPDEAGLSEDLKADMYARMLVESEDYLKCGILESKVNALDALEGRQAVEFGLRITTPLDTNKGRGLWDDLMIVLQLQQEDIIKIIAKTNFTADPAGSYQDGKPRPEYWGVGRGNAGAKPQTQTPDVNKDGTPDIGRLHEGIYLYEWSNAVGKGPSIHTDSNGHSFNVLRPINYVPTDRFYDNDWHFDSNNFLKKKADSEYSGGLTVLQHEGYNNFTGSAACQTFPKSSSSDGKNLSFSDFSKKLAATNQHSFVYLLRNL